MIHYNRERARRRQEIEQHYARRAAAHPVEYWRDSVKRELSRALGWLRFKVPRGIRSLIVWAPVIWADRDWDYAYLFSIMDKKLSLMADAFERYDPHVGAEKTARQLRIAAECCKRLADYDIYKTSRLVNELKVPLPELEILARLLRKYSSGWWY